VEQALTAHPAVAEVAVVGAPDQRWGEVPVAFVVARDAERLDQDELRGFARKRLARFKVPKRIEVVEELPKTATGKIQKFLLRERVGTM
jgi:fatty-acyl-CoA synthase